MANLVDTAAQQARCIWPGHYRWWHVEHESHSLEDAIEGVRNFLAGHDFDTAVNRAQLCFDALRRFQQSIGVAALAGEILETLPETHSGFARVVDEEAQAHLALGFIDRAHARYLHLVKRYERLAQAEPARADYQRDLVISLMRMAEGPEGREHLLRALSILEALRNEGRLAPVDEPMIAELRRLLAS